MATISCGLLQIDPSQYGTAHDYQVSVAATVSSLARKGVDIVVLPEYAAMIGAFLELHAGADGSDASDGGDGSAPHNATSPCVTPSPSTVAELARMIDRSSYDRWMDFFAASAISNKVYLSPGTFLVPVGGGVENLATVFSPSGSVAAVQGQTHVSEEEDRMGFVCSTDLTTFNVRGHVLGIAIGTDAWYPEIGRILALLGVDTILAPTAVRAPYTVWRQTRGLWQVVQQNQVFGVEVSLAGSWLDTAYQGRSRVFAPVEVTPEGRGVLAEGAAGSGSEQTELTAVLDPQALREARSIFPVFDQLNVGMYRTELSYAYTTARGVRTEPERG